MHAPSPFRLPRSLLVRSTTPRNRLSLRSQCYSVRSNGPADANMSASSSRSQPKPLAVPRPSSSVLLISPANTILLLHRVKTSSSFASAHVFPGGNLDPYHDGEVPAEDSAERHVDGPAYRLAAIRETFEESGILLAKNNGFGRLVEVPAADRDQGRRQVHQREVPFTKWLAGKGGRAHVDGLIPCTRWITPTNVPKRFTTQMYLYFLPLPDSPTRPAGTVDTNSALADPSQESLIPTPDGGIEHTAARFAAASEWIQLQDEGKVILFPPQMYLLSLVNQFLQPRPGMSTEQLKQQRQKLRDFLRADATQPSWALKVMSPMQLFRTTDKRTVLGLDKPGPELKDSGRSGDSERVALVRFQKEGPREVEIRWRNEVLEQERQAKM